MLPARRSPGRLFPQLRWPARAALSGVDRKLASRGCWISAPLHCPDVQHREAGKLTFSPLHHPRPWQSGPAEVKSPVVRSPRWPRGETKGKVLRSFSLSEVPLSYRLIPDPLRWWAAFAFLSHPSSSPLFPKRARLGLRPCALFSLLLCGIPVDPKAFPRLAP